MTVEEGEVQTNWEERRALPRLPTTLRAKAFPGEHDCIIKDYNERGARLYFPGRPQLAEQLVVVVWSTGLAFEAFTRWKSATEIGVRFVRSCDFRGRAPSHLLDIKALWMKSRTRSPRRALMSQKAMVVGRKGR
jgi:hypothetical protein